MPGRQLSEANRNSAELDMNLHMSHDDFSRARFMIDFKRAVNLGMGADIRQLSAEKYEPEIARKVGHPLSATNKDDRKELIDVLETADLYKAWASMTYISQGMMWDIVDGVLDHDLDRLQKAFDYYSTNPNRLGSLKLNPALKVPANIGKTEIHRQPGGFCYETSNTDITAGARYNGGGMMYSQGKGRQPVAGKSGGDFVATMIKNRFGDFAPKKILEVGCGTGRNTTSYARLYPGAEIHAIDVAAPLLRFAHAYAESEGVPIHFAQMDATALEFPDQSFDLVVSHIMGHETTQRGLPKWVAEAWRVLKPGGVMFHLDVPTQPGFLNLADQVMNDWQVRFNGEPFWMGWADADLKGIMREIGIPEAESFAENMSEGPGGRWFCHGARKPKDWSEKSAKAA
jgi:SAM-dependent methyltransferase